MTRKPTVILRKRITVNHDTSWRDRLGTQLRRLSSYIDRRQSIALSIQIIPELTMAQIEACIHRSLRDLDRYISAELRAEAEDLLLRKERPDLFID